MQTDLRGAWQGGRIEFWAEIIKIEKVEFSEC